MPPRSVQFTAGGIYHLYNRSLSGELLFSSADDYRRFLVMLKARVTQALVTPIAYCLMPTHYHFVLRQDADTSLSTCVQGLFNAYVQVVNRLRERRGPLFEGRFHANQILSDEHLLQVCRYVHSNPVEAGIAACPEDWPWSNYREWIGARRGTLVCRDVVSALESLFGAYRMP